MEQLLRAKMANTIVLLEGVLTTHNEDDRSAVSRIKGMGLNLVALPRDTLYQLQDGIIVEIYTKEGHAIQVLNEKKFNIEQLSLQCDELVSQNQQIMQTVDETCQPVLELSIATNLPIEMWIHCLASGVCSVREETTRV